MSAEIEAWYHRCPDGAHSEADRIVLDSVPDEVAAAYRRLVDRCRWWAFA